MLLVVYAKGGRLRDVRRVSEVKKGRVKRKDRSQNYRVKSTARENERFEISFELGHFRY